MSSSPPSQAKHASDQAANTARADLRARFLREAGWADAEISDLGADASTRSYQRLVLKGANGERHALLMNAPPGKEAAPCPPDASPETRSALGYNALARLAGPNMHAFIAIAAALREAGLCAPEIFASDPKTGFALIEDFGDGLFARAVTSGADETELYGAAIDVLAALHGSGAEVPPSADYTMLDYDGVALAAEADLLPEWYIPFTTGKRASTEITDEYRARWSDLIGQLPAPDCMVLRDYHAENLLWMPERKGLRKVGVIDFQDGLRGNRAYDLVSLLEDARRDVSPELAHTMIGRYMAQADQWPGFDRDAFRLNYAILGAQRNAKILGVFARLIKRDNKPRYGQFLPRVKAHFRRDLDHEALAPMKKFVARAMPEIFS